VRLTLWRCGDSPCAPAARFAELASPWPPVSLRPQVSAGTL
jgi:hypothetical protein